jgi:hypothetical protein
MLSIAIFFYLVYKSIYGDLTNFGVYDSQQDAYNAFCTDLDTATNYINLGVIVAS